MTPPAMRMQAAQQQALSPRLQRAVKLLLMSSLDFTQALSDAAQSNPFLEFDPADEAPGAGVAQGPAAAPTEQGGVPEALADWAPEHRAWGDGALRREGDDDRWMDTMAVEESLTRHLHAQLDVLPLPERDRALAKLVVESLDDDGYLRTELAELAEVAGLEPAAEDEEMRIALCRVQALDPAGVGARGVQEALLLQVPEIDGAGERELVRRMVAEELDRVAAHDVAGLARALDRPVQEIEQAYARIRRLNPRPGWCHGGGTAAYVTPDVIVRKQRGVWSTSLNPAVVPRVRLNRVVEELFRRQSRARHPELSAHLQEARWTLRNVEQRFATIVGVAEAIVERQQPFLEFGPMAMKPLALREIADRCGVHESTVSRVTNNKYIATPGGTFELKYFFSRPMATAGGGACSPTALRGLVGSLIESECPAAPLSDAEIARELGRQGLVIARRTVTKYRQMLQVEPAERRRRLES